MATATWPEQAVAGSGWIAPGRDPTAFRSFEIRAVQATESVMRRIIRARAPVVDDLRLPQCLACQGMLRQPTLSTAMPRIRPTYNPT